MPWVRRAHDCLKPTAGHLGDLWRCEICGRLWSVEHGWYSRQAQWFEASWIQRLRYRKKP